MFKHAHRVKDINLGLTYPRLGRASVYAHNLWPVIMRHIHHRLQCPSSPPIFPNLLTLRCRWQSSYEILFDCIPRMFNPGLRAIRLYGSSSQVSTEFPSVNKLLSKLKHAYVDIEDLAVVSGFAVQDVFGQCSNELSELTMHLPHLRLFHSNVIIGEDAICHLSTMRHLTSLVIRIPDMRNFANLGVTHNMESLHTINLYAPDLESCTAVLQSLRTPCLRTMDLQFSSPCTSLAVRRCFQAIRLSTSLRSLRLWADRVAYGFHQQKPCTIAADTLGTLYALSALQDIRIEEHIEVHITDGDALEIARAWPRMRKLIFTAFRGHGGFPELSPLALVHFAKHCPQLSQLGLAFDTSYLDLGLLDQVGQDDVGKNLYVLEVHPPFSYVDNPGDVAKFLFRLFPHLQSVRFGDTDRAMTNGWLLVSTSFRTLSCGS